jgi:cell wall-associated NlpC family hydrolase
MRRLNRRAFLAGAGLALLRLAAGRLRVSSEATTRTTETTNASAELRDEQRVEWGPGSAPATTENDLPRQASQPFGPRRSIEDRLLPGRFEEERLPPSGPLPAPPPELPPIGERVVVAALSMLGTPYVWDGNTPAGFDCSGLTSWAWRQVGIEIGRTTWQQWGATARVGWAEVQPGDLVWFHGDRSHVGLIVDGTTFIHAPDVGRVVLLSSLADPYWSSTVAGFGRPSS